MNPVLIFLPVLVVVALTLVSFVRLGTARAEAVKAGQDPAYYKAYQGTPEPEAAVIAARHWSNLYEAPVLFYAGCVSAYALGAVGAWTLVFAWGFALFRVAQSIVHLTVNHTGYRGLAFVLGLVCVFALWANVGWSVAGRI